MIFETIFLLWVIGSVITVLFSGLDGILLATVALLVLFGIMIVFYVFLALLPLIPVFIIFGIPAIFVVWVVVDWICGRRAFEYIFGKNDEMKSEIQRDIDEYVKTNALHGEELDEIIAKAKGDNYYFTSDELRDVHIVKRRENRAIFWDNMWKSDEWVSNFEKTV
jgi:ABC-type multidrug transport system fused ATPase/permease subunit